jgi:hypothetical protein
MERTTAVAADLLGLITTNHIPLQTTYGERAHLVQQPATTLAHRTMRKAPPLRLAEVFAGHAMMQQNHNHSHKRGQSNHHHSLGSPQLVSQQESGNRPIPSKGSRPMLESESDENTHKQEVNGHGQYIEGSNTGPGSTCSEDDDLTLGDNSANLLGGAGGKNSLVFLMALMSDPLMMLEPDPVKVHASVDKFKESLRNSIIADNDFCEGCGLKPRSKNLKRFLERSAAPDLDPDMPQEMLEYFCTHHARQPCVIVLITATAARGLPTVWYPRLNLAGSSSFRVNDTTKLTLITKTRQHPCYRLQSIGSMNRNSCGSGSGRGSGSKDSSIGNSNSNSGEGDAFVVDAITLRSHYAAMVADDIGPLGGRESVDRFDDLVLYEWLLSMLGMLDLLSRVMQGGAAGSDARAQLQASADECGSSGKKSRARKAVEERRERLINAVKSGLDFFLGNGLSRV